MALNEAAGYRRSNLTKAQKREAEAAIFGLRPSEMTPQLSASEIERMRQVVAAHDQKNQTGIKEFDLNNPPKIPYAHQEYPKVVYHHGKRLARKAHNEEEYREALAADWKDQPFPADAPAEIELDPEAAAESAEIEAQLRKRKR